MVLFKHTRRGTGSLLEPVVGSETMVYTEIFLQKKNKHIRIRHLPII